MKKLLFLFNVLFLLTIGMAIPFNSSANEFYEMVNYLDITNLRLNPHYGSMVFETVDSIRVKKNVTYTLVVDASTMGKHADYYNYLEIEINQIGSSVVISGEYDYHNSLKLYYFEFEPETSDIEFIQLPIDLGNNLSNPELTYNAMLYEGSINDFNRFEVYVDPEVGFQKGFVPIDFDNQLTEAEIKNLITAKSYNGQTVTVTLESSNYKNTKNNGVGSYEMSLIANVGRNYRRFKLLIEVIDIVPPVITAPNEIIIGIADVEEMNESDIKKKFTVFDNADKTLTYNDLVIEEENFMNAINVGEYMVKVSLTDNSGNKSTKEVTVLLQDNRAPVITGPDYIYLYSSSPTLTEEEILSRFTAYDNEEKEYKDVYITKNNYGQKTNPGVYEVTLESKDNTGNTRRFNLRVYVMDDRGPIFNRNELVLTLDAANQMTNQQLIDWFYGKTNLAGESVSNVQIIYNEYENNKTLGGTYNVYLQYERDDIIELAKITIDVEKEKQAQPLNIALYISFTSLAVIGVFIVVRRRKL